MRKLSSSGIIQGLVGELKEGQSVTLKQVWQAVNKAGIDKPIESVYADCSNLASRGLIRRGVEKRTYCKVQTVSDKSNKHVVKKEETAVHVRQKRTRNVVHSTESILAYFQDKLGDPIIRPTDENAYCVVLLGDWDGEYISNRAQQILQNMPTRWFIFKQGERNVALGFLP
jgi:hypothetical protein